jgi:hypothetical protein
LALSFAIAAMFWVGHFRLLRSLNRSTVGLIYQNLLEFSSWQSTLVGRVWDAFSHPSCSNRLPCAMDSSTRTD